MGHPVIMGRKTYDSFLKALPGRENIVITRQSDYSLPDATVVHSLEKALEKAKMLHNDEIFILGGAQIFVQSMPILQRIYLTRIHESFEGDTKFPEINLKEWEKVKEAYHAPDDKNKYAYSFQLWERR